MSKCNKCGSVEVSVTANNRVCHGCGSYTALNSGGNR